MAKKQEEVKLEEEMANIYDEKTKEMSLDSTDFIKMNQSHSALSRDNDTDKKIDTQISDMYKKRNKMLIAIICILVLTILLLLYGGYTLYSKNNSLNNDIERLTREIKALNEEIGKKEEPVIEYKDVFVGDSLIKNYNLSKYLSKYPVINSNRDNLSTEVLLNNLKDMVFTHNPEKVFIYVGLNDLDNKVEQDTIINNIKDIVFKIRENNIETKVYILSLIPLGNNNLEGIKSLNEEYSKLSNVTYVDIYSDLKEANGEEISMAYLLDNKKDLNEEGYKILTNNLNKHLEK